MVEKVNPNKRKNYITLYADDYDRDVWKDYCDAADVPYDAVHITIYFDDEDIDYDDGEHEDLAEEEHTCCICGKKFVGYGNNPSPVKDSGVCCDECNNKVVIAARLGIK